MDQLLLNLRYEKADERVRQLAEGKNQDVYLETVEDPTKQRKVLSQIRYA